MSRRIVAWILVGAILCFGLLGGYGISQFKHLKNELEQSTLRQSEMQQTIKLQSEYISQLEKIPPSSHSQVDREKATQMGYIVSPVANTGSMEPTINGDNLILLDKVPVAIGDIVAYQNGDDIWVHRIIGEYGDYWLCQGDANRKNNQIEYVPKGLVVWRVMGVLY